MVFVCSISPINKDASCIKTVLYPAAAQRFLNEVNTWNAFGDIDCVYPVLETGTKACEKC